MSGLQSVCVLQNKNVVDRNFSVVDLPREDDHCVGSSVVHRGVRVARRVWHVTGRQQTASRQAVRLRR